jgi:hypothetical protein
MKEINVREIRSSDYNDIYLLNQDLNSKHSQFSAEKVKERIDYILKVAVRGFGDKRFRFCSERKV